MKRTVGFLPAVCLLLVSAFGGPRRAARFYHTVQA